jgi:hypothetical protein
MALFIEGSQLKCRLQSEIRWSISIDAIILIAEYTTNAGPADDWFLVFVTREAGSFYFTTYAMEGEVERALEDLGQKLGSEVLLQLVNSTEWDSRVIWPPELSGHAYYLFRKYLPKTLVDRVRRVVCGESLEYTISDEVRSYIQASMDDAHE